MKQRYNALDIKAALVELTTQYLGCRVVNIYDCDHKTYLIKLNKPDSKGIILIESGIRIHSTEYDLPKNLIPSGFAMKLRKHIRSRRLEKCSQVGADRIVDLQFGSNEAAYHLIVELYDRGNILLTDYEYQIISVLRPRTDENTDVKFTVKEKYPLHLARQDEDVTEERLKEIFEKAKDNDDVKKVLTANLTFGGALIEHCLSIGNFPDKNTIGKNFSYENQAKQLFDCLKEGENIIKQIESKNIKGYIIQRKTKTPKLDTANLTDISEEELLIYDEFHPFLFEKFKSKLYVEFDSFDQAVDEFFSKLESQKSEVKESNQNRDAIKKLDNVKKDHQIRIEKLKISQTEDEFNAQLIEYNLDLVDQAVFLINSAVANQMDWNEISEIIEDAKEEGHNVALSIKELKLDTNHIVLSLSNPDDEENPEKTYSVKIDLGMNAYRNSRKYYDLKKSLFAKEKKTIDASDKALKSAEKRTLEILKQASKTKSIIKSRKPFWFEKFYWFISSENYLVIGGRDQQQNELIVKKYLKAGDVYVHADLNGASSVIIKNPTGNPVNPKTLNEAGSMAVCYSVAWDAKVLANAYWVYHDQVSKQAPTGEYIGTGSFMIRGKKNFLPQTALVFGFALMYKLEENSIFRHENDRKVRGLNPDELSDKEEVEFNDIPEIDDEKAEINSVNLEQKKTSDDDEKSTEKNDFIFPDTSFKLKIASDLKTENNDQLEVEDEEDNKISDESSNDDSESDERKLNVNANSLSNKNESKAPAQQKPLKKGQKTRLNKIKKKYKDQDDEDRELVMQFLGSAGNDQKVKKKSEIRKEKKQQKDTKRNAQQQKTKDVLNKKNIFTVSNETTTLNSNATNPLQFDNKEKVTHPETKVDAKNTANEPSEINDENEEPNNEVDENQSEIDKALLKSLTGQPLEEDELLFCLPVCAPYSCITNYKHKVKITPGTTKRGKGVKTAMEIFNRDKTTSVKEKELIKTILAKDLDGRNFPGKIKISAPNLNKNKKK